MRKYSMAVILLLLAWHPATAQTLEEKAANQSCVCLGKANRPTEAAIKDCIAKPLVGVAVSDSTKQYLRQLTTVEAVQDAARKTRGLLLERCEILRTGKRD